MLVSILIPVYNEDVRTLAKELSLLVKESDESCEIIFLDDGSLDNYREINKNVLELDFVNYIENPINKGRSFARNKLAEMAKGEWLWYLDCDSLILDNKQILKTYIKNARQDSILSGGRVYQPEPPKEKSKQLHWKWGYQRELSDPVLRMRDPVNHFLSNNFFLHKSIFNKIRFDIQLLGYGYEDTLFAAEAVHCGFRIIHILNSVLHNGLEPTDVFLNKIEQSLDNLIRLRDVCREKKIKFPVKSKLILAYKVLSLPVLFQLFGKWFIRNEKLWKVQLRQSNPSLQIFDAWRLARLLNS